MKQKQDSGTLTADFNAFLPILLGFEGGYVEDPTDPGGETNKGVTMSTFQQYAQELLGVDPTSDNLKALTDDQAGTIYRTLYWNKIHGDDFASQYLANIVCDFFVNSGTHATKRPPATTNSSLHQSETGRAGTTDQRAPRPTRTFLELARPLLRNYYQKDQLLGGRLCPGGSRIQEFLDGYLANPRRGCRRHVHAGSIDPDWRAPCLCRRCRFDVVAVFEVVPASAGHSA
jgi:hypothetical protein